MIDPIKLPACQLLPHCHRSIGCCVSVRGPINSTAPNETRHVAYIRSSDMYVCCTHAYVRTISFGHGCTASCMQCPKVSEGVLAVVFSSRYISSIGPVGKFQNKPLLLTRVNATHIAHQVELYPRWAPMTTLMWRACLPVASACRNRLGSSHPLPPVASGIDRPCRSR